jgi:methionyl-tRNA formyltransferase
MIKNNLFLIPNLENVVFIGYTDQFANLIEIIKKLNLECLIITSSDQAKNIHSKIEFKVFNNINNHFKKYILNKFAIDKTLFISIGSRIIFSKNTISNFFKNNLVNFHSSRLPLDSGGGNMSWRIMRNDRIDNQLVHIIDDDIDAGPIIMSQKSIFPRNCQIPIELEDYSKKNFLIFFKEFIENVASGKNFKLHHQVNYLGRYNPRLDTRLNGWIDWNLKSADLIKFINAFEDPYSGAQTTIRNLEVKIKKAQLHGGDSSNHPFMSGLISRHDNDWLVVSTIDENMLLIECVLDSKNKNIIGELKVGDRFITPIEKIYLSKKIRARYSGKGLTQKKI